MNYQKKYLKYKEKYLNLKSQYLGGAENFESRLKAALQTNADFDLINSIINDPDNHINYAKQTFLVNVIQNHTLQDTEEKKQKNFELFNLLINKGSNVDYITNPKMITPLMMAIKNNYINFVDLIINQPRININKKDAQGKTALFYAVQHNFNQIIIKLIEKFPNNINLNEQDLNGKTALMYASESGFVNCLQPLIAANANVNLADLNGKTALMYASESGCVNCIKALTAVNANVNLRDKDDKTALLYAIKKGNIDCIKALIEANANINQADLHGKTPLIHAIISKNIKCIQALINGRANVNQVNSGMKPLTVAINNNCDECAEILIKAGATK